MTLLINQPATRALRGNNEITDRSCGLRYIWSASRAFSSNARAGHGKPASFK